jgi:hypothetical protein
MNQNATMDREVPASLVHSATFMCTQTATDAGYPIHTAVQHGDLDLIRLLIERGVDVDTGATFRKETPIHTAAKLRKLDV